MAQNTSSKPVKPPHLWNNPIRNHTNNQKKQLVRALAVYYSENTNYGLLTMAYINGYNYGKTEIHHFWWIASGIISLVKQ